MFFDNSRFIGMTEDERELEIRKGFAMAKVIWIAGIALAPLALFAAGFSYMATNNPQVTVMGCFGVSALLAGLLVYKRAKRRSL
jgi:FtsH-binding integral membrane protein